MVPDRHEMTKCFRVLAPRLQAEQVVSDGGDCPLNYQWARATNLNDPYSIGSKVTGEFHLLEYIK